MLPSDRDLTGIRCPDGNTGWACLSGRSSGVGGWAVCRDLVQGWQFLVDPSRFAVCLATLKYPANLDTIFFESEDLSNAAYPKPQGFSMSDSEGGIS